MTPDERDWKHLARIKTAALDRLCQRILDQVRAADTNASQSAHARYLEVYRLISEGDDVVAATFNDLRRSNMVVRVMSMHRLGLLTAEDRAGFTDELQALLRE